MLRISALLAALLVLPAATVTMKSATPPPMRSLSDAGSFDFLVGNWDASVTPEPKTLAERIHGARALRGTWTAARGADGHIEDELRIMDGGGTIAAHVRSTRRYDERSGRWIIGETDQLLNLVRRGTGSTTGGDIVVTTGGRQQDGRPVIVRTRFFRISPGGFSARQDRSTDGGATWQEGALTVVARRVSH